MAHSGRRTLWHVEVLPPTRRLILTCTTRGHSAVKVRAQRGPPPIPRSAASLSDQSLTEIANDFYF